MQRKNWIDWAKSIGILLVVMGHSQYSNQLVTNMIFMIHMPLFFVISGYLFKITKYKSLIELSIDSWKTLIVPYLLFNFISALFKLIPFVLTSITIGVVDWNAPILQKIYEFPKGIALTMFVGPSWFLLALVWCRYLTYLIHTQKLHIKILVVCIWSILLAIRIYTEVQYWFAIDCGIVGLIWFEIGYLIKKNPIKLPINKPLWCIIIPISATICYIGYKYNGQCNYVLAETKGILGIASTSAGLLAFFGICKLLNSIKLKLIIQISKATLLIMCMHMMLVPRLNVFMHFEGKMFYTLLGDLLAVLILTGMYPFFQKHIPVLIGRRK